MNRVNEEAKMAGRFANDSDFKALLGIADACLRSKPQRIRYCIHCLEAALLLNVPMQYEAHVRVQLGSILLKYTENIDLARKCLERAVCLIQTHFLVKRIICYRRVVPIQHHRFSFKIRMGKGGVAIWQGQ